MTRTYREIAVEEMLQLFWPAERPIDLWIHGLENGGLKRLCHQLDERGTKPVIPNRCKQRFPVLGQTGDRLVVLGVVFVSEHIDRYLGRRAGWRAVE